MSKKLIYSACFVLMLGLVTKTTIAELVLYYPLNEGGGATAYDLSGNGNDGTLGGDPQWMAGKIGDALDFDGDDYVDAGNSSTLDFGTNNWTVTAWAKTTMGISNSGVLFGKGGDQSGGIRYTLHVKGIARMLTDDDSTKLELSGNTTVNDDVWHHLAAVKDGNTLILYVDGELDATGTLPDGYDLSGTTQHNAYVGAIIDHRDGSLNKYYTGLIDDVRVYNHALSEAEIEVVMTGEPPMAPAKASGPSPGDGQKDVPLDVVLSWRSGKYAPATSGHEVYFSEDFNDVRDGVGGVIQDDSSYTPAAILELSKTYYWRVDEVNGPPDYEIYQGYIWSFTAIDHILVDDFEDYNDFPGYIIYETWPDGWEVETNGAVVGHEADVTEEEHYIETTVVHGGSQSMPYFYNNIGAATYSEAGRTFSSVQNWTREGVKVLSLWFRGHPLYMGGFVEEPTGTYTMTADGADIWDKSDQFHFAWQQLQGAGSIVVKVLDVQDTDPSWAKAGVMIRDTLDADSAHAMVALTPGNGVWFGRRTAAGGTSDSDNQADLASPLWVKLERTIGGLIRASYSTNAFSWLQLGSSIPINMDSPMYIGLAVTSHNPGVACEARFSNVTSDGTGEWTDQDIGMLSNEAEPMYVTVEDGSGKSETVYHDDPNSALINAWTEWNIELNKFSDAGVALTDVNKLSIGFGDADNPQPGGSGLVFFDDIRLYVPRLEPEPEPEPEPVPEPPGGWIYTYTYTGDAAAAGADYTALDGTWSHDNGSDQWDETAIGDGNPGGVSLLDGYIRLQDPGRPDKNGIPDPSNRKVYFGHSVTKEAGPAADAMLDTGVTISFRARVASGDPSDPMYPNPDGDGENQTLPAGTAWPAGGNGYLGHDGGKGNFSVYQLTNDSIISFSLALASESMKDNAAATTFGDVGGQAGLVMNNLVTDGDCDPWEYDGNGESLNILPLNPTEWHEYWITIEADTTGTGTHLVKVYLDGSLTSSDFIVSAGNGNDYDDSYIGMGLGASGQMGAIDVDYFSYTLGVVVPQ